MTKEQVLKDVERQLDFLIYHMGKIDINKIALRTVFTRKGTPYECIHNMDVPEMPDVYPLNDEEAPLEDAEEDGGRRFSGTGYDNGGDDDLPPGVM